MAPGLLVPILALWLLSARLLWYGHIGEANNEDSKDKDKQIEED